MFGEKVARNFFSMHRAANSEKSYNDFFVVDSFYNDH